MKSDLPENLSAPARRALFNEGITTLAQLAKHNEAETGQLHGMGPKGIEQLKVALRESGLAFAKNTGSTKKV